MKIKVTKEEAILLRDVLDVIGITTIEEALRSQGVKDSVLSVQTLKLWRQIRDKLKEKHNV